MALTIVNYHDHGFLFKVTQNEVKNASFVQRSAHREGWNMATGIDRTGRSAQAMRLSRVDDDGRSYRPTPTHRFCHSAIFHPITPYNFWFSESADLVYHFGERNWNMFRQILRNSRKCAKTWSKTLVDHKKRLGFLPSSLWKVFLRFFLQVKPIPIRKDSDKASVHRAFSPLKRKTRIFIRRFFRLSANFRPHSSAIVHPNTHKNFFAHYQHMINDGLSK